MVRHSHVTMCIFNHQAATPRREYSLQRNSLLN